MPLSIFNYMDARQYLVDYFNQRKKTDTKFSYALWAAELKLNNKTLLRMILQGKRQITSKSLEAFKKSLNLDTPESEYFEVLIDYNQSKTSVQRQAMGYKLIQIQRQHFSQTQRELPPDSGILNDSFSSVIMTTISSSEWPLSSLDLAQSLSLEKGRVEKILNSLLESKSIIKNGEHYTSTQATFKIADSFGHSGLRNYYNYWLQKSIDSIDLPKEIRRFRSLQLVLSTSEYEEVVKMLQEHSLTLLSKTESNTLTSRRVYLLNTALFPVSNIFRAEKNI